MNKQKLIEKINETKKELAKMEKMLEECDCQRWKPKEDETYYYINPWGKSDMTVKGRANVHEGAINFYNCFRTREQAETEIEKILVRRMLEEVARRLNKGEEIDWYNPYQEKYCIYYDCKRNKIDIATAIQTKAQGCIHCLDMNFKDVAIKEIGKKRLENYLRGE